MVLHCVTEGTVVIMQSYPVSCDAILTDRVTNYPARPLALQLPARLSWALTHSLVKLPLQGIRKKANIHCKIYKASQEMLLLANIYHFHCGHIAPYIRGCPLKVDFWLE